MAKAGVGGFELGVDPLDRFNDVLVDQLSPYAKPMAEYMPYSFAGYFIILAIARVCRVAVCGSGTKGDEQGALISKNLQFLHNVFLALQSAFLMYVVYLLYMDTAVVAGLNPVTDFFEVMVSAERPNSKFFEMALVTFLASKLYETLDTVLLILNNKSLLL